MEQNKTGKYFKYAIGEIILVVIGILIALQINNWNEQRQQRKSEYSYLKDLKQEFTFNKEKFDKVMDYKAQALNRIEEYIELMKLPLNNLERVKEVRKGISGYWTFNPSNGVIESLMNTGNIELIQNDSLKYLLAGWKDVLKDYQEEEANHINFFANNWQPIMNTLVPRRNKVGEQFANPFHDDAELIIYYKKAFKNLNYQNLILLNQTHLTITVNEAKTTSDYMNKIIELINSEIKN